MNQEVNGGQWNSLGIYTFSGGASVRLTDAANGVVIADAVMLVEKEAPPPVVDDIIVDDPEATYVGTWSTSTISPGYIGSGYRYRWAGFGSNTATWEFNILTAGNYEVFVRWTEGTNRATDAPYTVYHAGGSTTVDKNQQTSGGQWISLGSYNFNTGTNSVRLTDAANGVVIADAVMLVYNS
jgi:hypothetical protein